MPRTICAHRHTKITVSKTFLNSKVNGKICHIYGFEDLILLTQLYSPNWFIDVMQSLSEFKFVSLHKWTAGPKYTWSFKTPRTAKITMEKKEQRWRIRT